MRPQVRDLAKHVDWLEDRTLLAVTWVEQGPGPITGGQVLGMESQGSPVAGAVQAIAAHPTNPDILVVGTVQGGIWKTTNATSSDPTWTPRSDFNRTLAIMDIVYSPIDPQVMYAGTGSFSNGFGDAPAAGVLRSIDFGDTWQPLGQVDAVPYRIRAIVPTLEVVNGNQVLYAGAVQPNNRTAVNTSIGGLYRSRDGGTTWQALLSGAVSDMKADPRDSTGRTVYAVMPGSGVVVTTDGGDTWNFVNSGINSTLIAGSINARLSISNAAGGWRIAVGFVNPPAAPSGGSGGTTAPIAQGAGEASGVFISSDPAGVGWSSMGVPADIMGNANLGTQGNRNFSLALHPTQVGVAFVAGDRSLADGTNGVTNFVGHVMMSDGSGGWTSVIGDSALGTAPHADSRDIEFDAEGHMFQADDGGIYRLLDPTNGGLGRTWVSTNGNIRPTEVNSVAYDSLNNVFFIGNQDTGTAQQSATGSLTWTQFGQGDGNTVGVAHYVGETVRYLMGNNFDTFERATYNSSNQLVANSRTTLTLASAATPAVVESGLNASDRAFAGFTRIPYQINPIDPEYLLVARTGVYVSANRGDIVTDITPAAGINGQVSAVLYGGALAGTPVRDLAYVGDLGGNLFARFDSGALVATQFGTATGTASGLIAIRDIELDPENARTAYVLDGSSRIWRGTDVGLGTESWTQVSGNLPSSGSDLRTIEVYNTTTAPGDETLLAGGIVSGNFGAGVFFTDNPYASSVVWNEFGSNLPNVLVTDIQYNADDDLLIAGTNGRGVWTVPDAGPDLQARTSYFDVRANAEGSGNATGAGESFQLVVTARKADGSIDNDFTGTVHFVSSDGNADLPGDASFDQTGLLTPIILDLVNGQAAFTTTLNSVGTQTITVNQVSRPHVTGTGTINVGRAGHTVVWSPHFVYVDTNTILRGDGMSWSQTMNWNVDRLPTADDDVFLGTTPVQLRNLSGAATTIFAGSAGLNIGTGGSLSISGDSAFQTLILEGNSLTSNGTITVNGGTYWGSGTINLPGTGTLDANGGFYVYNDNGKSFPQGTINFTGNASFTGGSISGGGTNVSTFTQVGGQWDVSGNSLIAGSKFNFNGGSIDGTLPLRDSALVIGPSSTGAAGFSMQRASTISGDIAAAQTVLVQSDGGNTATLTAATSFTNAGTLTLANVSSTGTTNFVVTSGTLTNAPSGVININAGSGGARLISADITNDGTFNVNVSGILAKTNGVFENKGQVNVAAGAELSFGASSVFTQSKGNVSITDGGAFVLGGDTFNFNGGTISGIPLLFDSALTIGVDSKGAGTFSMRRASTLSGDIAEAQTILIQSDGGNTATLTAAVGFKNHGVISLENVSSTGFSNLVVSSGKLTNESTGAINSNAGTGGFRTINADITNNGTINFNVSTSLTKISGLLTNNSAVNIASGAVLNFGGSNTFTQDDGTLTIVAGGVFVLDSDTFNFNGGTVSGVPELFDSALVIGPSSTGAATFSTRRNSTLSGDIAVAQTVLIQSDGGNTATLTAAKSFSNFGVLTLENLSSTGSSNLVVANGELTNALGGVFNINAGTGGGRTINADVINNGTLNFNVSTGLTKSNGFLTNNQQVNIAPDAVLSFANSGVFTQAAGTLTINGSGVFVMDSDTFNFNGGSISGTPFLLDSKLSIGELSTGAGTFSMRRGSAISGNIAPAQTVLIQSDGGNTATLTAANGFTNSGTLTLENLSSTGASNLVVTSGTLTNAAGGVINSNIGTGGARTLSADVINNGTVNFNFGTTLTKTNGTFTNNSQVNIAANMALEFGGNAFFTQSSGKLTIDPTGAFVMDGDTLNFNGGSISSTPILFNSTLNIGSTSTGAGTFSMRRGSSINGNIAPAQTVLIQSEGGNTATLTAANGFTNSGTLTLENLSSTGASNLVVTSGTLTNAVGGVINSNFGTGGGRTINADVINNGTVNFNFGTTLTKSKGTFTNNSQTNIAANVALEFADSSVFTQGNGKLTIDPAGAFVMDGDTLNFNGGSISSTPILFNSTLNIGSSSTGAGTFSMRRGSAISGNIAAAQTVLVQSEGGNPATLTAASSFTNSGTLTLENLSSTGGSNLVVTSGVLTNAVGGVLNINAGTGGGRTIDANVINNGTVNFNFGTTLTKTNGVFTNNAQTNIAAGVGVGIAANGVFTQAEGKLSINETGALVLDGGDIFNFTGGAISGTPLFFDSVLNIGPTSTGAGTFLMRRGSLISGNIASAQTVIVQSDGGNTATLTAANGFTNSGTLTLENVSSSGASNLVVTSGVLTNAVGGVINSNVGTGGGRTISADVVNNGTVNFNMGTALTKTSGVFTNNAQTNIAAGVGLGIAANGVFTQAAGELSISEGGSFVLDGDTFNFNGGSISGTPIFFDSALNIGPSSTGAGTFSMRRNSSISGNIAAAQTVLVQSDGGNTATLTAATGFTNAGTLILENVSSSGSSNLVVTSGVLTNAPSGVINLTPGTGGYRVLSAELVNQGVVNSATSATLGRDGADHLNTGTLNVTGGELFVSQTGTTPTFTNNGTINISDAQVLTLSGGALTNFSAGVLAGGTYNIGGTFRFPDAAITTNSANVSLNGPSSQILSHFNGNGLANLFRNTVGASFGLQGGRNFVTTGGATEFINAGTLTIPAGTSFTVSDAKKFTQHSGVTTLDGTLTTTNSIGIDLQGGVLQGSGDIGGNLQNAGTLNPGGTPGVFDVTGNYVQTAAGVLNVELADPAAGQVDVVNVAGSATLDGTLNLIRTNLALPDPAAGVSFNNMTFASRTGGFAHITGRAISTNSVFKQALQPQSLGFIVGIPDPISVNVVTGQLVITDVAGIADNITVTLDTGTNEFVVTSVMPSGTTNTFRRAAAGVTAGVLAYLEDGNDRLDATTLTIPVRAFGFTGRDTLRGGSNNDSFSGEDGDDSLEGFGGNDTLMGGAGNDTASGAGGTDSLVGDAGDDRLLGGGAVDTLDGGFGIDFLSGGASVAVISDQIEGTLSLTNTGYQTTRGDRALVDAGVGNTLGNVTLQGSDLGDVIDFSTFTVGRVTVMAGGGNDSVLGGLGADVIFGGDGNDTLLGGGGQDQVFGDAGNDTVNGGGGSDTVSGGLGNDRVVAGSAVGEANVLREEADADLSLSTTSGTHTLTGAGTDVLLGLIVAAQLTGGLSANVLTAINFSGLTTLNGGAGNDTLIGSSQLDFLIGGAGADSLVGNSGNDSLFGDDDNDVLLGGVGNDFLRGGTGDDLLEGGADIDRVVEQGNTNVIVVGLQLSSPLLGSDTATEIERIELTGGSSPNLLDARQSSVPVLLNGSSGNDTLLGSSFADDLNGSSGDDVLSGGGGIDTLDGSSGRDIVYENADTNFTVNSLRLTSAATGDENTVRIEGFVLVGGNGNNILNASLSKVAVTLLGGAGDDTLTGGAQADVLIGGSRADVAGGVDSLTGGGGADTLDSHGADTRVTDAFDQVLADVLSLLPSWIDAI